MVPCQPILRAMHQRGKNHPVACAFRGLELGTFILLQSISTAIGANVTDVISSLPRKNRVILTGMLTGLILSFSADFLLLLAQRVLNWLVLHGFAGGVNADWNIGQAGPISIITSPVSIMLLAVAGSIAGFGVGIFAAALLPDEPARTPGQPAVIGSPETVSPVPPPPPPAAFSP
jgi:hypothetical protein